MRPERWKLLTLCLATFMLLLDITIVQAALPAIQRQLGGGLSGLQWTVDAYTLPLAALIISLGTAADRFGRRTIFLGGVAVFSAASLACGLSQSMVALDIWRAVQGAGGAAMFATTSPWSGRISPARRAAARSLCGARRWGPRWRAARCSAGCSPSTPRGGGSSSSTSRSAS
jgi:MFS family permease